MATSTLDSDSATERCTAEPIQVPTASVNPAAAPAPATATARMAEREDTHSYPQNSNGGEYAGVPFATIFPQPQNTQQQPPPSPVQRGPVQVAADDSIDDSGTESGEELRSLNPQLLAEVRGALVKLENALPNLDAAKRTSLIPLVNKLQSCLKVTQTPPPTSSSPRSGVSGAGSGSGLAIAVTNESAAPTTTTAGLSKNRKTRHTIGVSREELQDARKWLVVAQNVADHFEDDHGGCGDVIDTTVSPSLKQFSSLPQAPIKYEPPLNSSGAKVYKPVKFIPTPAPKTKKSSEDETTTASKSKSESESEYFSGEHGDFSSSEEENRITTAAVTTAWNQMTKKPTPSRFDRKSNKNKRMKRANTIDVVPKSNRDVVGQVAAPPGADAAHCECWFSGDETATVDGKRTAKIAPIAAGVGVTPPGKPAPPQLQLKTENDKKFAAFLEHTKQDESQSHSKTSAYNPSAAGGIQWSNRFSNIKTTFENAKQSAPSPPPHTHPQRPLSLTPTVASAKPSFSSTTSSSQQRQRQQPQPVFATFPLAAATTASTTMLPRQSFTHAQKSPFKPVTKVAPFHTRSPPQPQQPSFAVQSGFKQPKLLSFKMSSADHQVHAPKTYYSPSLTPIDDKKYASPQQHTTTSDAVRSEKPLTPTVYYAKNDYFLNEPSSYLHGGVASQAYSPSLLSPTRSLFAAPWPRASAENEDIVGQPLTKAALAPAPHSNQYSYSHRAEPQPQPQFQFQRQPFLETQIETETRPSPRNGQRSTEFSQQCAPVAKIMGTAQQSVAVLVDSKTKYQSPRRQQSTTTASASTTVPANTSTYQKLAEKSPSLQNFTKTQPKNWSSSQKSVTTAQAQTPSHLAPPSVSSQPIKKQIKILTLNESEENLPEQFFVLNQRNKFESLSAADGARIGAGGKGGGGRGHRTSTSTATTSNPIRMNEKAFFKPLTAATKTTGVRSKVSPTVVVQQSRSPPQSPVIMPSVLQKSESWHQMIMEKMKQAKPPSPVRQNIPRAKSTHNLTAMPKQYEPAFTAQDIAVKQQTVQQFLGKTKQSQSQSKSQSQLVACADSTRISSPIKIQRLNEDFKHVDEAFDILFEEASGNYTKTNLC